MAHPLRVIIFHLSTPFIKNSTPTLLIMLRQPAYPEQEHYFRSVRRIATKQWEMENDTRNMGGRYSMVKMRSAAAATYSPTSLYRQSVYIDTLRQARCSCTGYVFPQKKKKTATRRDNTTRHDGETIRQCDVPRELLRCWWRATPTVLCGDHATWIRRVTPIQGGRLQEAQDDQMTTRDS